MYRNYVLLRGQIVERSDNANIILVVWNIQESQNKASRRILNQAPFTSMAYWGFLNSHWNKTLVLIVIKGDVIKFIGLCSYHTT